MSDEYPVSDEYPGFEDNIPQPHPCEQEYQEIARLAAELKEARKAIRVVAMDDGYEGYRAEKTGILGYIGFGGTWRPFPDHLQPAVRAALADSEKGG